MIGSRAVAAALCALVACTPTSSTNRSVPAAESGWRTYRDREVGFAIAYPPSWHLARFDGCGEAPGEMLSNIAGAYHNPMTSEAAAGLRALGPSLRPAPA